MIFSLGGKVYSNDEKYANDGDSYHSLCTRHYAKGFTYIISFNSYTVRYVLLLLFYKEVSLWL